MEAQEKAKRWKELEQMLGRIQDPVLRNAYMYEMSLRAERDWGMCPTDKKISEPKLKLDEIEQELLEAIKVAQDYGVNPIEIPAWWQAEQGMMWLIRNGGGLESIPAYLRCPDIDRLYTDCLHKWGEEIYAQMEPLGC